MRHIIVSGLVFLFLASCQTTRKGSDVLEAPSHAGGLGQSEVSAASSCEANGGEIISGYCVCSDGDQARGKTCAQHVKETYPNCYKKGGITKKWDNKNVCMCEHGEIINANGSKTCYQLFAEKNRGCSQRLGIQTFDDHACRCLHGPTFIELPTGRNCRDDFRAKNAECYAKGGVTKTPNGPCECRDGSFVEGENKRCSDKWFFYPVAEQNSQGTQQFSGQSNGKNEIGGALPQCICTHTNWKGSDYCMIYSPGEKYPHQFSKGVSASACNFNHCFTHFNDSYRNKCNSNVKFRPSKQQAATQGSGNGSACFCNVAFMNGQRACGLFVGNSQNAAFAIQTSGNVTCDDNFCRNRWGHDPYVRSKCSQINNGRRIQ